MGWVERAMGIYCRLVQCTLMHSVPLEGKLKVIIPVGSKCPQSQNGRVKMVEDILCFLELHIAELESPCVGGESENHGKKDLKRR